MKRLISAFKNRNYFKKKKMTFDLEFEEWSGFQEIWPGQDFRKYGQGWEGSFPFEIKS